MAGPFYIDSAATGANNGSSWADAWTSPISKTSLASGEILYIAHNSVDVGSYSGNYILAGPTSGKPAQVISVTSGTTAYAKSNTNQFDINQAGPYQIVITGAVSFFGIQFNSGGRFTPNAGNNTQTYFDCRIKPAHSQDILPSVLGSFFMFGGSIDCANDTGSSSNRICFLYGTGALIDVAFENVSNRSTTVFDNNGNCRYFSISGCDFSGLTHVAVPDLLNHSNASGRINFSHNKLHSTSSLYAISGRRGFETEIVNCSAGNNPEQHIHLRDEGELWSDTTVYRSGGKQIEGTNISWGGPTTGVETSTLCSFGNPFVSPWMPIVLASGSNTIRVYFGNTQGDLYDTDLWLELEYKATTSSGEWTFLTGRPAIGASGTLHADDTGSTWNGETMTYMQYMELAGVSVGQGGLGRVRVAFAGNAGSVLTSTDDLYVDPLPVVS